MHDARCTKKTRNFKNNRLYSSKWSSDYEKNQEWDYCDAKDFVVIAWADCNEFVKKSTGKNWIECAKEED